MRIGVYIEGNPQAGGGFTHQLNMLRLLGQNISNDHEIRVFCLGSATELTGQLDNFRIIFIKQRFWKELKRLIARQKWAHRINGIPFLSKILQSPMESVFVEHNVDLVYFPCPSVVALELSKVNYIFTVWDLCHLNQPEFPEVRLDNEFERREDLLKRSTMKAVSIITDSESGKEQLVFSYQLDTERVVAIPFLPSIYAQDFTAIPGREEDVLLKYHIRTPYIFYPAQFWAHKNHVYLLSAIRHLHEDHDLNLQAVFSGVDKGNLQHVLDRAEELGITDSVNCIGFADDRDMPYLYKGALALTMPTYFGPTNIPPLDAFALGCPVCYSDLPGFKAELGDAAFYMDLSDPDSLVRILLDLINQPKVAEEKIRLGQEHVSRWGDQHCWQRLNALLTKYEQKQVCWK